MVIARLSAGLKARTRQGRPTPSARQQEKNLPIQGIVQQHRNFVHAYTNFGPCHLIGGSNCPLAHGNRKKGTEGRTPILSLPVPQTNKSYLRSLITTVVRAVECMVREKQARSTAHLRTGRQHPRSSDRESMFFIGRNIFNTYSADPNWN